MADNDDEANYGPHIVRKRLLSQITAYFKLVFENTAAGKREAVSEPEGKVLKDVPDTQNVSFAEEGGPSDEIREFVKYFLKRE